MYSLTSGKSSSGPDVALIPGATFAALNAAGSSAVTGILSSVAAAFGRPAGIACLDTMLFGGAMSFVASLEGSCVVSLVGGTYNGCLSVTAEVSLLRLRLSEGRLATCWRCYRRCYWRRRCNLPRRSRHRIASTVGLWRWCRRVVPLDSGYRLDGCCGCGCWGGL